MVGSTIFMNTLSQNVFDASNINVFYKKRRKVRDVFEILEMNFVLLLSCICKARFDAFKQTVCRRYNIWAERIKPEVKFIRKIAKPFSVGRYYLAECAEIKQVMINKNLIEYIIIY